MSTPRPKALFILASLCLVAILAACNQVSPPAEPAEEDITLSAQGYSYRYVSLDEVELPSGFSFFWPRAINNSGRIYGIAFDDVDLPHVAVYERGALTVLQPGWAEVVNQGGTIGGGVIIDPENFRMQAALFHGNRVELIPPQPGEVYSVALALNDSGTALVWALSELSNGDLEETYVLYKNGRSTPIDFGTGGLFEYNLQINNRGIISGITLIPGLGERGFRFDTRTGETTLLNPLPTEQHSWALDINNRGDVLGYSFVFGGTERIGVWDRRGNFTPYFVEGTSEFPTISNHLVFNDNNLIVITAVSSPASERGNSYLVPKPGVRLNLADLVHNLPSGQNVAMITAINNHGDMIGCGAQGCFLLERTGAKGSAASTAADTVQTASSGVENRQHTIPAAAAAMVQRRILAPHALKSGSAMSRDDLEILLQPR